ncbi:hypothetical protein ACWD6K_20300 [Streptomyces sp. NPDC002431]
MGSNEPGRGLPSYPWGVIGAAGAVGAVSPSAASELVTEVSSFTKFRDRVDHLLQDLAASPAAPGRVGADTVGRDRFGGGRGEWTEADALHSAYAKVVDELEGLSRLLSDCIEGMSIAVLGAHQGYQNVDLEIRERMSAIQDSVNGQRGPEAPPAATEHGDGRTGRQQPRTAVPEDTSGGEEL